MSLFPSSVGSRCRTMSPSRSPELDPQRRAAIADYVMVRTEVAAADLCFVFGTRHGVDDFVRTVVELWDRGLCRRVLISGGVTPGHVESEAEVLARGVLTAGVPAEALILERAALNTRDNVVFSLPLLQASVGLDKVRSVLAVGKICSTRRYLMTLERHMPSVRKMVVGVNYFGVPAERWFESADFRDRVLGEWRKIPVYLASGDLRELSAP